MRYGFLTNLDIKISYLNLQLELLEIKDLVIILEPSIHNTSEIEGRRTKQEVFDLLTHLLKNFKNHRKGKKLKQNPFLTEREKVEIQAQKELIFGVGNVTDPDDPEAGKNKPKVEEDQSMPNILGPELYELIFGRLDFKIRVENIKIYYEYNHTTVSGTQGSDLSLQKSFSVLLHLNRFTLTSVIKLFNKIG